MKIIRYGEKDCERIILLLGFFDCLHKGHMKLVDEAKKTRDVKQCKIALFTFENYDFSKNGEILLFDERIEKAQRLGIDEIVSAKFDESLKNTNCECFIKQIVTNLNIECLICGFDYTFGKGAEGNVDMLRRLCKEEHVGLKVIGKEEFNGEKISTTRIKSLLSCGKIREANELLGEEYFITGTVVRGRQVGRTMGFPTANVNVPIGKFRIKDGVYKTHTVLCGKRYDGITNYGSRPTFGLSEVLTETYFKDFNDDLYGREITVFFDDYIRDIVKFYDIENLKNQLEKDKNA